MTTAIPLTALVHDGVMARCYLSLLCHRGFVFERIVRLVYTPQRGLASMLPGGLRSWYAAKAQQAAALYWLERLPRDQPRIFSIVNDTMSRQFGLPEGFFQELVHGFDYRDCGNAVELVAVTGFRDPRLARRLADLPPGPILFTGGGILPASLLQDAARPFLHVHPGRLPDVRGADGVLWSVALFGRPSASCFVMAPGLDTGALIAVEDFAPLAFTLPESINVDVKTLYRFLYAYCDPILRADLFSRVVQSRSVDALRDIAITATPQDQAAGHTYNFMHARLQEAVLRKLFLREG